MSASNRKVNASTGTAESGCKSCSAVSRKTLNSSSVAKRSEGRQWRIGGGMVDAGDALRWKRSYTARSDDLWRTSATDS